MNFTVIRQIDKLGRIVIPKDIRKSLDLNLKDSIKIIVDDKRVFLEKLSSSENK